jgi:two-component system, LytTR family, response regulator LytT
MKYRVLIIEDEIPNSRRLERLIHSQGEFDIYGPLQTISSSIEWLSMNSMPDIIFMDIQLLDGESFKIFDSCKIDAMVIFTTAYDQYALRAFEVNAIDYLLKPIDPLKLEISLKRAQRYIIPKVDITVRNILSELKNAEKKIRQRFLVNFRDRIVPILMDEIAYFYSESKITHIVTKDNHNYTIDLTLEKIEEELDPDYYMRVTRQVIVKLSAIKNIFNLFNGQIGIEVIPMFKDKIHLSREKSIALKQFLDK